MEIDRVIKLENTESKNFDCGGLNLEKQYEGCIRCLELSDKLTKADEKCVRFELEIEKNNSAIELLKQRNEELEKCIRNAEGEDDKLTQLMVENKVLEIGKKKAETEINAWMLKCKELEMLVKQMKSGEPLSVQAQGTPTIKQFTQFEGFEGGREHELKPSLYFLGEASPHKNLSPLSPGIRCPSVPIVIIPDSDDDDLNTKNVLSSTDVGLGLGDTPDKKELTPENKFEHDLDSDEEKNNCFIPTKRRKIRKPSAFIVASDNESESDDDVPLCQLKNKKNNRKKRFVRRRLKRVGENEDNKKSTQKRGKISSNENEIEMDDLSCEGENMDSSCEGESMDSFIVETSVEDSESESASENDGTCSEVGYNEVMSSLRRGRKDKMVWEYEADMLADLAKRPEVCMRGVCAIYRRQTNDEKYRQMTLYVNREGFSQVDASTGSDLAEFIMSLDIEGDVKSTVEELQKVYPDGVEECRRLSIKYSKQLFEIYLTEEDPFFHP